MSDLQWLNPWRFAEGEDVDSSARVRRATDETHRRTTYQKLRRQARGASEAAIVTAHRELDDTVRLDVSNTKEIARLARKVAREADKVIARDRARYTAERAVRDGIAREC